MAGIPDCYYMDGICIFIDIIPIQCYSIQHIVYLVQYLRVLI